MRENFPVLEELTILVSMLLLHGALLLSMRSWVGEAVTACDGSESARFDGKDALETVENYHEERLRSGSVNVVKNGYPYVLYQGILLPPNRETKPGADDALLQKKVV